METQRISFGGISVEVPIGWEEISSTMDGNDAPWTLVEPENGVGALQFSIAIHRRGEPPNVTLADLTGMLEEFLSTNSDASCFDQNTVDGPLRIAAASYREEDRFSRVWYASNGLHFVFATYNCSWEDRDVESSILNRAMLSLEFADIA